MHPKKSNDRTEATMTDPIQVTDCYTVGSLANELMRLLGDRSTGLDAQHCVWYT